jgi:hypothetical protein
VRDSNGQVHAAASFSLEARVNPVVAKAFVARKIFFERFVHNCYAPITSLYSLECCQVLPQQGCGQDHLGWRLISSSQCSQYTQKELEYAWTNQSFQLIIESFHALVVSRF